MIHLLETGNVRIAKVAGHQEGRDLTASVAQKFVAAGDPLHHNADAVRPIALMDDIRPPRNLADIRCDGLKHGAVITGEIDGMGKAKNERVLQGAICVAGGRRYLPASAIARNKIC